MVVKLSDYGNLSEMDIKPSDNRKNQSKVFEMLQAETKSKIQESNEELEKKYECGKCARIYKHKRSLNYHLKYECDVMPQFRCQFCYKRFKQKMVMIRHENVVHLKANLHTSKTKYNCDQCTRSYTAKVSLARHKRNQHEDN